ncbi:hypothetical protein ACFFK0_05800 [Paenibacillus chartarius]|uniref:Uncharacterized protein n=1 Tax=Paenibacillus chartarius TaxID=747481 RepID=A0ABV6DH35_9BACL
MSELPWMAIEDEAVHNSRDVIQVSISAADCSGEANARITNPLLAALQSLIYSLDDSWKGSRRKPPAFIPADKGMYESVRGINAIRLLSGGTADLFGITPVTHALGGTSQLLLDTRDLTVLQRRLVTMAAGTVLAYERFLHELLEIPASIDWEWASPGGERSSLHLSTEQLQNAHAMINEIVVTEEIVQVKGSLTAINLARKTFTLEAQDGQVYKGRVSEPVRKQYSGENHAFELPVKVEAVIERRISSQASIQTETIVDTLAELDTHLGLDVQETLYSCKELFRPLDTFVEGDSEVAAGSILSLDEYTELAKLLDDLAGSNPTKGARRLLSPSDMIQAKELLSEGKPICRLVTFCAQMALAHHDFADEYDVSSAAYGKQRTHSNKLTMLIADAYPDYVKLRKLMLNMIHALEAGEHHQVHG